MNVEKMVLFYHLQEDEIIADALQGNYTDLNRKLADVQSKLGFDSPVLLNYTVDLLMKTETPFARAAAHCQENIDLVLWQVAIAEVENLFSALQRYVEPDWLESLKIGCKFKKHNPYRERMIAFICAEKYTQALNCLMEYYSEQGFGPLSAYSAFRYDGTALRGLDAHDEVTLAHIVGYEAQKEAIIKNTDSFLYHNKGNNLLLYGERGTGKSSMIKAVANEYAAYGVSLVEVPAYYAKDLPVIMDILREQPRKFIVFMDDLAFETSNSDYRELKAVLEGGIASMPSNVLIYATSNRRNLIQESWRDRERSEDDLSVTDTMSEKLSLSDRFGVTIVFHSPQQEEFLRIVEGLAQQEGLDISREQLREDAIRWALWQNTRSGRTAKQFIASLVEQKPQTKTAEVQEQGSDVVENLLHEVLLED